MELYKDKEWMQSKTHLTNEEISQLIGCSKSTIRTWMKKLGIEREDEGASTYKNKQWLQTKFRELKYAQTIGKEIGVSGDTIEYWRKKLDIKKENDNQGARKYFYKDDYFNVIDSEDKAYWLGFIMADGAITRNVKDGIPNRLSILLKSSDYEHLEKMQQCVGSNQPIVTKIITSRGHSSSVSELRFNSKVLCNNLIKLGVTTNKTGNEIIPDIDNVLLRHFVRGFFDGDGCIYKYKKYINISIGSCSLALINHLKQIMNELNIEPYIEIRKQYSIPFYVIGTKKQKSVKIFLDYMYKDATIYLNRKYEKYQSVPLCSNA